MGKSGATCSTNMLGLKVGKSDGVSCASGCGMALTLAVNGAHREATGVLVHTLTNMATLQRDAVPVGIAGNSWDMGVNKATLTQ